MSGVDLILWRLRCGFGVHLDVLGWCGRGRRMVDTGGPCAGGDGWAVEYITTIH